MRILFVLNNTYPNGKASSARVREYGKGFVTNGIDTIVLMPQPRIPYNCTDINPEGSGVDKNGVKYFAITGSQKRSRYLFIRQIEDLAGKLKTLIWLFIHLEEEDKVIIYEGTNNWITQVQKVCQLKKVKVGFELNELPSGTGTENALSIKHRKKMLESIFPRFDFFLCISQPLYDLATRHSPKATVIKVPIMSEGQLYGEYFPKQNIPYIFHSGSLTEQKDGILGMIKAFGLASKQIDGNLEFILTGNINDSPHAEKLKSTIKEYGIEDKVKFVGYLDLKDLRNYQKNCFLTIINKLDTKQNKYCFSTKLSEYLSFARPVITTTIGEANMYLEDGINAFIVEPNKPELIAEKIVFAYTNPQKTKQIGENGHKLTLKEFDCIYQTKRIINLLDIH